MFQKFNFLLKFFFLRFVDKERFLKNDVEEGGSGSIRQHILS